MDKKLFDDLVRLVERCIFHSELKDGYVISGVHVNLPVNGNMDHTVTLERRMVCETAKDARMEENASSKILAHELAFMIEHEDRFEKSVYQESESGEQINIGKSVILIDRKRIRFPDVVETKTEMYLDCAKAGHYGVTTQTS